MKHLLEKIQRTLAFLLLTAILAAILPGPARAETKPDEWLIRYAFKAVADQNGAQGDFVLFNLVKNNESRTLISSVKYQIAGKTLYGNKNDLDAFQKALMGKRYWNATSAIKIFQKIMGAEADGVWGNGTWIALADHSKTLANKSFNAGDKIIGMIDLEKTWLTGENSTLLSSLENNQVAKTQMDPRLIAAILDKTASIEFISYLKDGSSTTSTTVTTTLPSTTQPTSTIATTTLQQQNLIGENTQQIKNLKNEILKLENQLKNAKDEISEKEQQIKSLGETNSALSAKNTSLEQRINDITKNGIKAMTFDFTTWTVLGSAFLVIILGMVFIFFVLYRQFSKSLKMQNHARKLQNEQLTKMQGSNNESFGFVKEILKRLPETPQNEAQPNSTILNSEMLNQQLNLFGSELVRTISKYFDQKLSAKNVAANSSSQDIEAVNAQKSALEEIKKLIIQERNALKVLHKLVLNHLVGDEENPYFVELLNRIDLVRRAVTALEQAPVPPPVEEKTQTSQDQDENKEPTVWKSFFD